MFFNKTQQQIAKIETQQQRFKNDVAPGGNKAILTLANGKQIILDSAANGTISQQGNTKVIKLNDGQLAYQSATGNGQQAMETSYNTITTPKGGQYQIVLADGSKVWLNAASSLRYPTSFSKDRNVALTGEGYFEVIHNATKPFTVSVNRISVEDLGTHFNINAYSDEQIIKTTLLEGSVRVTLRQAQGDKGVVIKPGQQAILPFDRAQGKLAPRNERDRQDDKEIKIVNADVEEAVAWKNGFFQFKNASIETIMKQVARWYDVEVIFESRLNQELNGTIPRNMSVSNMFKIFELTGKVHFKIEGKKVTVMK